MDYFQNQQTIFTPLLQGFCDTVGKLEGEAFPPAPFLPHVCADYGQEGLKKVFYIGQEVANWLKWDSLLEGSRQDYLTLNNAFLDNRTFERKEYPKVPFWRMCKKIHKQLHKNTPFEKTFTGFGWGNLNAIEPKTSLEKRKNWQQIAPNYSTIKKASYPFDKLPYILEAYQPDIIFVLHWSEDDKKRYLTEGSTLLHHEDISTHFKIRIYKIADTLLIWTSNPSKLMPDGFSLDKAVAKIFDALALATHTETR